MEGTRQLIENTYEAFNRRDVDNALAALHPDVDWADGSGGSVHGRREVRDHWLLQWASANRHIEPLHFGADETGASVVDVHVVARDSGGRVLEESEVQNVFRIEDGLIRSMEIRGRGRTPSRR